MFTQIRRQNVRPFAAFGPTPRKLVGCTLFNLFFEKGEMNFESQLTAHWPKW